MKAADGTKQRRGGNRKATEGTEFNSRQSSGSKSKRMKSKAAKASAACARRNQEQGSTLSETANKQD